MFVKFLLAFSPYGGGAAQGSGGAALQNVGTVSMVRGAMVCVGVCTRVVVRELLRKCAISTDAFTFCLAG